jgi:hypothetical protein
MRKKYQYLTSKRFPTYWPCAEMLKQHLKNMKRTARKHAALAVALTNADASDFGANESDVGIAIEGGSAGDNEGEADKDSCTDEETEASATASSAMPMTSA